MTSASVVSNLRAVQAAIAKASSGRSVRLVAVSKKHSVEAIQQCYEEGHRSFGENYINELLEKAAQLKDSCSEIMWHYIGSVQSNKVRRFTEEGTQNKNIIFCSQEKLKSLIIVERKN